MTHRSLHVSAIALSMAAFVSLSPLSAASADPSAPGAETPSLAEPAPTPSVVTSAPNGTAPTPSGGTPSLSEPAPTPSVATTGLQRPSHAARRTRTAWRNGHRYAYDRNPVAAAATGVAGGIADLGSLAAYPIYCFPHYGSCRVYRPYP
ncbi:MAG: hypothetical protein WBQ45_04715 [Roseiarcus sp.]|jgi:hypothetical protein|uniref:hypothetical protein n=2 Tax=Roseiarcus sp. TaxID=1969460 RepID=UPI003BB0EAC8